MAILAHKTKVSLSEEMYSPLMLMLGDAKTYLSTSLVNLQGIVGEDVSSLIIIGTQDDTPVTPISFQVFKNKDSVLQITEVPLSNSERAISINCTTSEPYEFSALLRVNFVDLGISQDILLIVSISTVPAAINVSTALIDFGLVETSELQSRDIIISSTSPLRPELVGVSIVDGQPTDINSFYLDLVNTVKTAEGFRVSVYYTPSKVVASSITVRLQYGASFIGYPIVISGTCNADILSDTVNVALEGAQPEFSLCYVNTGTLSFRITSCILAGDDLNEFELLNSDIILGHVLHSKQILWVLVKYTPKQSALKIPSLTIKGVSF